MAQLGGETIDSAAAGPFWSALRDHTDPFFIAAAEAIEHQDAALWRLSVPATAPLLGLAGDELIEWHGAQRWLAAALPPALVRDAATAVGGHATLFRGRDKSAGVFAPLAPPLRLIHERLKRAFDPNGILNPRPPLPGPVNGIMQTAIAPEFAGTPEGSEADAILRKCVHCGFCTATCPTYQLLGDELDGPRGRIYLMKQVLEGCAPTR